jgi:hypothetical protein
LGTSKAAVGIPAAGDAGKRAGGSGFVFLAQVHVELDGVDHLRSVEVDGQVIGEDVLSGANCQGLEGPVRVRDEASRIADSPRAASRNTEIDDNSSIARPQSKVALDEIAYRGKSKISDRVTFQENLAIGA